MTTLRWPDGSPHSSSRSSARVIAEIGVCDAGFRTTGQPAAIAGATLCATRLSGKLNGLIAPTTPIGRRSVKPSLPTPASLASIGIISPARSRAAAAANVNVDTARVASTRAVLIGFAASSADDPGEVVDPLTEQPGGGVEDLGALATPRAGRRAVRGVRRRRPGRPRPGRRPARGRPRDRRTGCARREGRRRTRDGRVVRCRSAALVRPLRPCGQASDGGVGRHWVTLFGARQNG